MTLESRADLGTVRLMVESDSGPDAFGVVLAPGGELQGFGVRHWFCPDYCAIVCDLGSCSTWCDTSYSCAICYCWFGHPFCNCRPRLFMVAFSLNVAQTNGIIEMIQTDQLDILDQVETVGGGNGAFQEY